MSEQIVWRSADSPPDAEMTVLVFSKMSDDPIWLAYWTGDFWVTVEGYPLKNITHWAEMPEGPQS